MRDQIILLLELMGHFAVTPSRFVETKSTPNGLMAGWSERHVAYACGLGTFGLNGLMITSRGCAVYLNSIVCDLALTPTPRNKDSHTANCLYYYDGSCRKCIERCAGNAINDQGRSNLKCRENLTKNQPANLKQLGLDNDLVGGAPACGLCSNGVPCEDKIPVPS
jgi:epoxyqueuosine reductase QueG